MTVGQQCCKAVFGMNFKLKGEGARLKGGECHGTTLWGKHVHVYIYIYIIYHDFNCTMVCGICINTRSH